MALSTRATFVNESKLTQWQLSSGDVTWDGRSGGERKPSSINKTGTKKKRISQPWKEFR